MVDLREIEATGASLPRVYRAELVDKLADASPELLREALERAALAADLERGAGLRLQGIITNQAIMGRLLEQNRRAAFAIMAALSARLSELITWKPGRSRERHLNEALEPLTQFVAGGYVASEWPDFAATTTAGEGR